MEYLKSLCKAMGFSLENGSISTWIKTYPNHNNYVLRVNLNDQKIDYGSIIKLGDRTVCNFDANEHFVVLECVSRLLEKGYPPQNIILEQRWSTGHGTSGKLDILVTNYDSSSYLMIECKTYDTEFDKELNRISKNGGQLFTYFQQDKNASILMLYSSKIDKKETILYRNEIIRIEDDYRQTGNVQDFYDCWNKLTKNNGVFDSWVKAYDFQSKALTPKNLRDITQKDSSFIFNRFLEILRHNVVSDKPNAFNKIFALFLCKIYDEKATKSSDELAFQWFYTSYQYNGISYSPDTSISFQKRLTDLYKKGMKEFLDKEVTDISDADFKARYGKRISDDVKEEILEDIARIRLKKNNEFAIKEVFDDKSFEENAIIVKEVVELLQGYKIRYTQKQQYLSDFFELLLTTGLKQESGQFFTPVPIAQFIIKSIPFDKIIHDKLHKGEKDNLLPTIIDYAAGSGHFITETMHEIQSIINNIDPSEDIPDTAKKIKSWKEDHFDWAYKYVYGIEKDYRLVKVSKVGCYLHGDGLAQIVHSDGLGNFSKTVEYKDLLKKTDKNFPKENKQFDIVVSNPPYSVSAFKNNSKKYFSHADFELYNYLTDQSSEIECLFVERTKQLLKDEGIAAIILPSSILNNTGIYTKTREIILNYFEIISIVELGSNTFMATGTNTVILFMKRRSNYDCKNINKDVQDAILHRKDVAINGIENPISKYVNYVWQSITYSDYVSLLGAKPNYTIESHEIYLEYRKKLKFKNEKEFWHSVIKLEQEKILYFILTYLQKIVLVKTGEKNEEKQFLGYEFSNRRGNEGIHPVQRGKTIEECTKLFAPDTFENPEKVSTYIYQAFQNNFASNIPESLERNIIRVNLIDLLIFDRAGFEKDISLTIKKKVKIGSKWKEEKLSNVLYTLESGNRPKGGVGEYQNGIPSFGGEHIGLDGNTKFNNKNLKFVPVEFYQKAKQGKLRNFDILICKDGALTGKIALFKTADFDFEKCMINEHVFLLRSNEKCQQKYLFNILMSIAGQEILKSNISGQAQGGLSRANLLNIKIPLPPKAIQEKIIAEIGVLEKQEDENIKAIKLLKAKIYNLFTTKAGQRDLKSVLETINPDKSSVLRNIDPHIDVSFLSMPDVSTEGKILNWQKKNLREVKSGYTFFQQHDVLFAKITPCMENGKGALVPKLENNLGFGSTEFFVLRSDPNKLLPKLLFYITSSKDFRRQAQKAMTGASGHKRVPKSFIENFPIPYLAIKEQQKIVNKIEAIEAQIAMLEEKLIAMPQQKETILKRYL